MIGVILMRDSTAEILPPTPAEIEAARQKLREELAKSETQPIGDMRSLDDVLTDLDARINGRF
jgi:hypothetical protein